MLARLDLFIMRSKLFVAFHSANSILNCCNVYTDMKLSVSWSLACWWVDDIGNVECLSFAITNAHELVITRVQDDYSGIGTHSLCPRLNQHISDGYPVVYQHCLPVE